MGGFSTDDPNEKLPASAMAADAAEGKEVSVDCRKASEAVMPTEEDTPNTDNRIPIIFSTITGNAYKLAAAAADVVPNHVGPYNIRYITDMVIDKFDVFVLSYWCNHGTADDDTINLIRNMRGKKLIVIGTLGAAQDSKHAADVRQRVETLASESNTLLGHFLCQGSIDLSRTAARLRIPEGQKGHLSMERFERQKLSLGHPDEKDLADVKTAMEAFLKKI